MVNADFSNLNNPFTFRFTIHSKGNQFIKESANYESILPETCFNHFSSKLGAIIEVRTLNAKIANEEANSFHSKPFPATRPSQVTLFSLTSIASPAEQVPIAGCIWRKTNSAAPSRLHWIWTNFSALSMVTKDGLAGTVESEVIKSSCDIWPWNDTLEAEENQVWRCLNRVSHPPPPEQLRGAIRTKVQIP